MKLIRSALSVASFTILSRVFGFIRELLQAHYIGVSAISDALQIAIRIPSVFRRIFAEGAFNASFIPSFSRILAGEGRDQALKFAQNVFSILAITLIILVGVIEIFIPQLIPAIFRGLQNTPDRLQLTIEFTRITFPFLMLISFTAFFSGILNSFERFAAAAASPAAGNLAIIGSLMYLTPYVDNAGYALAWGVLLCGIIQFVWVFVPCSFRCFFVKPKVPELTPQVRQFLRKMLPAALGSGVVQINIFLDMMVGSYLKTGGISYIAYADRLNQLPLSVIGIAISTALLPLLSKQIRLGHLKKANHSQNMALEFALSLTLPALAGLIMLAPTLIHYLYQHGKFTPEDVIPTAHTLIALASGLPAYVLVKIFSTSFFSHGDTKTPMFVAALCVTINLLLNIALIKPMAHVGLALATAISSWLNVSILLVILRKRKLFNFELTLFKSISKITLASFFLVGYLYYAVPLIERLAPKLIDARWFILTMIVGSSAAFYYGIASYMGVFHWKDFHKTLDTEP